MNTGFTVLLATALTIGFLHTILGPDHYLPFIVISKANAWTKKKTMIVTFLCGTGHVLSSVIIGFIGIIFGITLSNIEVIEGVRGDIAAWMLMAFGFVYMAWGIKRAFKNKTHSHLHIHHDGTWHNHSHKHYSEHSHIHKQKNKKLTPWILFTVFILGPCEALIPLLMYPAASEDIFQLLTITLVFGTTTVATMMFVVLISLWGIKLLPLYKIEKWSHALAGFAIFISGAVIVFLGL